MSLAPTWLNGDAWRRADSGIENLYSRDYYIDVAKRAEASKLDFVFFPDTLYIDTDVLAKGAGFSALDPTIMLSSIAHETSHVGLLTTISTTFSQPYIVARQLQSLNWLSNGRVGWNVVTALGGHENFGLQDMPSSQERYDRAGEFVDAVRKLWDSFPRDALVQDRTSGLYGDKDRVQPINYQGQYFQVKGPLGVPAFPGHRIPLVQAGASPVGQNFAATIADAVFAATPDMYAAADLRKSLQSLAQKNGRQAADIRVLPGLNLYLADSRAEARDLYEATHKNADISRKIMIIREMIGLDLTDWPEDKLITADDLPDSPAKVRSQTHSDLLRRALLRENMTVKQLLARPEVMTSAHWQVVGTVDDAVQSVKEWVEAGAIDGFITVPGGSVGSMQRSLGEFIPQLAEEGLFRKEYSSNSFLGHLLE